jgi:MoxR-like ATPase
MSWPRATREAIYSLQAIIRELTATFVGRTQAARLLVLASVCREHLLLLGPPGTAKTDLITRFSGLISAGQFSYLLTRFTEPSEIFGPLDFERFQQGTYHIRTEGMLPEADIVFLDEVFQGSSAILNTLLTVINERHFHNGGHRQPVRLVSLFGASSELPEDPGLRAFSDRFLLRLQVEPVAGTQLPELLEYGWRHQQQRIAGESAAVSALVTVDAIDRLSKQVRHVDTEDVREVYAEMVGDLLGQGVTLSDRRIVRGVKLVAAAALLREAETAQPKDFWPLAHFWTEPGDAEVVRSVVAEYVAADAGEPVTERESPAILVARARQAAQRLDRRVGPVTGRSLVATLRTLNEIRLTLLRDHPHDEAAIATVQQLIDRTTERLAEAG